MLSTEYGAAGFTVASPNPDVVAVVGPARGNLREMEFTLETRATGETRLDVLDAAHRVVESHVLRVAEADRMALIPLSVAQLEPPPDLAWGPLHTWCPGVVRRGWSATFAATRNLPVPACSR